MGLRPARHRFTPIALSAGLIGSALLGFGATGTFSALTSTILNDTNTAGAGSIVMQETEGAAAAATGCTSTDSADNSSTCTTSNKYGGTLTLVPGGAPSTKTVRIANIGSVQAAAFTLTPGICTPTNPLNNTGSICASLRLTLDCTVSTGGVAGMPHRVYDAVPLSTVYSNGVQDLKTAYGCTPQNGPGDHTEMAFSVQLDANAGNTVQGQRASQPLTWQFSAAA